MAKIYAEEYSELELNGGQVVDYFRLMKPRVMTLVVFTALVGMILAPGSIHPLIGFASILCITVGAGSAATINMWYDRDIDAVMRRTQKRPIVTGKILPDEALTFGIITGVVSVILMAICVNILSSLLLAFTNLFYVFIYTIWLKRSSIQNIVIGGVAGALPPMIGWASVTGDVSLGSFSLFAIIFVWTVPHSWALAIHRVEDYRDCSVPMMPVVKGIRYTNWQILFYSILLIPTTLLPYYAGITSVHYLYIAMIANLPFIYYVFKLFDPRAPKAAIQLFVYSIFYLFILYLSLLFLHYVT